MEKSQKLREKRGKMQLRVVGRGHTLQFQVRYVKRILVAISRAGKASKH